MALTNIHVFVDDEVITADNLNSIGEAVSAEVSSGSIPSSSLVWPFVAQGDIDMNGYSISGIASFFGVYHVNDTQTLPDAVSLVNSAGGGTIIIDDATSAIAAEVNVTAANVAIIGNHGISTITVSATAAYGMKASGDNFTLRGCVVTGGVAGAAALVIAELSTADVSNNIFTACAGPCISMLAGSGNSAVHISDNSFDACAEQGIIASNAIESIISDNTFVNVVGVNIELGGPNSGEADRYLTITGNVFSGTAPGIGIYGPRDGTITTIFGFISIIGNTFNYPSGSTAVDLGTYYVSSFTGNTCDGDVLMKMRDSLIVSNLLHGDLTITGTNCEYANNRVEGTMTGSTGTANRFNSNQFILAVEIDAAWVSMFTSNYATAGVTVTTTDPDVIGLNWGY